MRLRKVKDSATIIANYPQIVISNPERFCGKWHEFFQNSNPIYIEIGMGKGKFICEQALNNPNINYIGIEKYDSVLIKAIKKVQNLPIKNLVLLELDAKNITNVFLENEIDKIYLNFSDPWPKSRHSKRRLTNANLLKTYRSLLKNKHTIEFKTDNRHLFTYSLMEFANNNWKIKDLSLDLHVDKENIITTEYEEKFISLNKNIYYVEVENEKI